MCGILAILFVAVPAVEIYVILQVGGFLGLWPTLGIIALTAIVGAALAKSQGIAVLHKLQGSLQNAEGTGNAIVEGVLVLAAGITLLAPGFITDAIGISLLLPPVRQVVAAHLSQRWKVKPVTIFGAGFGQDRRNDDEGPPPGVIDV